MKFTEASLEKAVIQLFQEQAYQYVKGYAIHKTMEEVLTQEDPSTFPHVENQKNFSANCHEKIRNSLNFF